MRDEARCPKCGEVVDSVGVCWWCRWQASALPQADGDDGEGWDLLLDYDKPEQIPDGTRALRLLRRAGFEPVAWDLTESTNGHHGKLRLAPRPSPAEAVALQAILGSDPMREACNLQRARSVAELPEGEAGDYWRARWNTLYKPNPTRRRPDHGKG